MKNNISQIFNIKNRNIVVTGTAGLLGTEYANILSSAGANVILIDINDSKNKRLESSIIKKYHTNAKSFTADITNGNEMKRISKDILNDYNTIDGLVNNAAYTTKGAIDESAKSYLPFENFPFEIWEKTLAVNLTGPFVCCKEFGKIMAKQRKGVIVNVSSIYGIVGADQRIYGNSKLNSPISGAATKGAIINFTRYLAAYWQRKNIRVNTLTLGGVQDESYQNKKFIKKYSEKTILGRMAKKNEFNGALLFLLSDASSYMTGANLVIDGGWTAW